MGGADGGGPMYSNHRTVSSSDRTLMNAFRTISNMCDRISLPKTISDRSNFLFKKVPKPLIPDKMLHEQERIINNYLTNKIIVKDVNSFQEYFSKKFFSYR